MEYLELLEKLNTHREENFAAFQRKLVDTKQTILGVRTPVLRKLAKAYTGSIERLLSFPDTYFEVTFIKLAVVAALPYERFILYVEDCVARIDNWATCDGFKAKRIAENKAAFLPILERIYARGGVFAKRYALVTLLYFYMDEADLPILEKYLTQTPTDEYYIHMAIAWLLAETLIWHYEFGIRILLDGKLSVKTHNKGIQKALESYRIDDERKAYLRSLKIKNI